MINLNLKTIISEYKKRAGVSNDYIADKLGVIKSAVSRWISGDVKKVKPDTMEKISTLVGFDIEPLLKGNIAELKKPILGNVKAGYNLLADENLEGYEMVTSEEYEQGDYFLRVTGDSMEGAKIHDGDLLYVKQCIDIPSGSIGIALVGDEVTVKKIIKKDNLLILAAANPKYDDRYFTAKEVQELPVKIIGKVVFSKTSF